MVGSDQCPYTDSCETDCVEADLRKFVRLTLSRRRRAVLNVLQSRAGEWVTVDEIVETISGENPDIDAERLSTELERTYLPMLRRRGLVDRDGSSSSVRYRGCPFVEDSAQLIQPDYRTHDDHCRAD